MTTTERGLFEQITDVNEAASLADKMLIGRRVLQQICAEYEQQLAECETSNRAVESALDDVDYKGTYADGVQLLKQQLAAAREEVNGLRAVAVSAQTLYSDSEEYEFDDGMGRGCGQIYWDDLGDSLEALSVPQSRLDNEDWWLSLAERHANQDWNSENPDGYLNAVKVLVRDALTAPLPEKNDHE